MITARLKKFFGKELVINDDKNITVNIWTSSLEPEHVYFTFFKDNNIYDTFQDSIVGVDYDIPKHSIVIDIKKNYYVSSSDLDRMIRFLSIMVQNAGDRPENIELKTYEVNYHLFDRNAPGIKRFKRRE